MLSLRMIIVAAIAGIALWGLFNLLDNLKEPGLLRTEKAVAVKGCDTLDAHPDAPRLCPQLVCQKALIDRKLAEVRAQFKVTIDQPRNNDRLVGGELLGTDRHFVCTVRQLQVLEAQLLSAGELQELVEQ
jgi:hypothetical protein